MAGKVRRMFPASNTSEGFYSYFDNILGKDANRIFILKGGPGTGKSTIMRRFADRAKALNYDLEFHHCASDPSSVDVVVIPELKVAILDGTAPHVTDPKVPGAVDEIINLGQYWNEDSLVKNKEKIRVLIESNSKYYIRTYKYLKAARAIYEDIVWKNQEALDVGKRNIEVENLVIEIFEGIEHSEFLGQERHLFGSAYTPDGWVEYTDSLIEELEDVYYIKGDIGTGKSSLLERVYKEGIKRGLDVEVFHSPLIPENIETIIIKGLNIGLTLSKLGEKGAKKAIDLNKYIDDSKLEIHKKDIEDDKKVVEQLINIAITNLTKTKENHDELEKYYSPNMNFKKLNEVSDKIISKTFK
ncbi:hypothetical protein Curi_c18570 [Gottschalkia acidurici 9a]|uniref:ATPase n=1 Tax=Gottschalkia acidurici (strain ATCC 7906 / DSM 604 / BCRC 14475 / CIP 104303 / KCTC 5404 / NCIMB 10678 / 9a) TaxID=1128398 RepID=K0AYL8_GOTA9|nr:hypothetical protein [Gottschalkia acidurici]AFS78863.1 hypothetical protein Curi_c18570 [Gottschalkia acidurici 9a]